MFFFFFFDGSLSEKLDVQTAFNNLFYTKMLADGYCDLKKYIDGRIDRFVMYGKLRAINSIYANLYQDEYPTKETALQCWENALGERNQYKDVNLLESEAIVNWVYQSYKTEEERREFTAEIFGGLKEFKCIDCDIKFKDGIPYNSCKIDLEVIKSIKDFRKIAKKVNANADQVFYRGHANANYLLIPSIFRSESLMHNESKMVQEIMIECPHNFLPEFTHLDRLVEMQHYGLPTRLLDITRNPLVALYFACSSNEDNLGEIVLLTTSSENIKYPNSDTVSLLASLPNFTYEEQGLFYKHSQSAENIATYNTHIARWLHEVRQEKPSFASVVNKNDMLNNYVVFSKKNNPRIVKQDGAFIICGLSDYDYYKGNRSTVSLNTFRS